MLCLLKTGWTPFLTRTTIPRHGRLAGSAASPLDTDVSVGRPVISWYPGHIAKAERLLKERLKAVDVILELRDARIAFSTEHPDVSERPTVLCCQVN